MKRALTSGQIRAARSLIRWRAEDLAQESSVGVATIRRAELAEGPTALTAANDQAIRRTLEAAGIEFIDENGGGLGARLRRGLELIDENGGGPGVRLRKSPKQKR